MLFHFARALGLGVAGMALASTAWGAEGGTNITAANSIKAKIGGEFRSELTYDDHGLDKTSGTTPDKTTAIAVQAAKIKLAGSLDDKTEYSFRFNLLGSKVPKSPMEYGYGTHWMSKEMGLTFGRARLLQGGWDLMENSYRTHHYTAYASSYVYDKYTDMIGLTMKMASGDIGVQFFNDLNASNGGQWNKSAHLTWALGWTGQFGGIKPLVNFGSYDNNKSRWVDVGVKTEMSGLLASLDIRSTNHVNKVTDVSDPEKNKEVADAGTGMAINLGYEMKGLGKPWFHLSTWDLKQGDYKDAGLEDRKMNWTCTDEATEENAACLAEASTTPGGDGTHTFDDNAMSWGLGMDMGFFGSGGLTPYAAIVSRSGKFAKSDDPTKEESKSQMWIRLGVLGEL